MGGSVPRRARPVRVSCRGTRSWDTPTVLPVQPFCGTDSGFKGPNRVVSSLQRASPRQGAGGQGPHGVHPAWVQTPSGITAFQTLVCFHGWKDLERTLTNPAFTPHPPTPTLCHQALFSKFRTGTQPDSRWAGLGQAELSRGATHTSGWRDTGLGAGCLQGCGRERPGPRSEELGGECQAVGDMKQPCPGPGVREVSTRHNPAHACV